MATLLELKRVSKSFGGIRAVTEVEMQIAEAEIHGLIGPNGAGKSTLVNLITGVYRTSEGEIRFREENISYRSANERARAGIARTFQTIRLWDDFTLLENVKVGAQCGLRRDLMGIICRSSKYRESEAKLERAALECLNLVGLSDRAEEYAGQLAYGQRRLLEIARALATRPKLLLLDEPAAGMNQSEAQALAGIIRKIRQLGTAVLVIEHNMQFIMNLCDTVTVLNFGEKLFVGKPAEVQNEAEVVRAYLGS